MIYWWNGILVGVIFAGIFVTMLSDIWRAR